jgi:hypothetical protein
VTTPVAPVTVPGVEQVIEGLARLQVHAMSGNINAKRAAALGLAELALRAGHTAQALSRAMAEPDMHYGPEVTERFSAAGTQFSSAGTACAEADHALVVLLNTTPAETMAAGRRMPHHEELSETGGR